MLHLLAPGERYGYEIVTTLTEQTDGALEVSDGTLYPVLYRLERGGYVASAGKLRARRAPGKDHRLTPAGQDELARLTHEWTTFANAMARLLRQPREAEMAATDDYITQVIDRIPLHPLRTGSPWSLRATSRAGRARAAARRGEQYVTVELT